MRVLHIVTAFPRSEGDVITPWLVEMLRGLKGRGLEVEVFASSYRGLGNQVLWGIPVHRFRYFPSRWEDLTHEEMAVDRLSRSLRHKIMPLGYLFFGAVAVLKLCRRRKYDVIHVHWPLPHALFGWLAKKASGARLVSTFYGAEVRWAKHSRLPLLRGFLSWAVRKSDRIIAISSYTAGEVQSLINAPIELIPYTTGFSRKKGGRPTRQPDRRIILTVGRLVERKGIRYLVDAIALLPEDLKAELLIVGGGPLRESLEAYVRGKGLGAKVRFAGRVSEEELIGFYQNASVYVQPAIFDSRGDTEMLGVVILEAMHHNLPVVASNVGGISDIVRHKETGLLVPEKDPQALAQAVNEILTNAKLRQMMINNSKILLNSNFKWDNILNKIIKAYI